MIYLTSQWFPQRNRASIMGLFYMARTAGVNTGITAFRRAAGDAWIYGASRLVLDVCY